MTSIFAAMLLAGALQAGSQEIAFEGCVTPGLERDTYVVTDVRQVPAAGAAQVPEMAHGRRVLFWLDEDDQVREHMGRRVEVRGTFTDIEESEIELKAGRQETGGFIVEFEGPGPDVETADAGVNAAVGTAGRTEAEEDDIQTYLLRIDVNAVRPLEGTCEP